MRVVVDTSVWSLALRQNTPSQAMPVVNQLRDLIVDGRVVLLGAVRQEVLSGIRHVEQFTRLRDYLRAFADLELTTEDYELAAEFYNIPLLSLSERAIARSLMRQSIQAILLEKNRSCICY